MRSLPAPNHPVLLCCACSSMSVPSSHWVAQTGHNTQVQHHRWGGNHTLYLCSQFSRLFTTTAHAQLLFNLLSTRTPSMSFLQCCCPGPAYRVTQGCFLSGAGLALVWAESHKVPVSLLKALWIAAMQCNSYFGQFGIISKHTESTLHTTNQAAKDNIKQCCPRFQALSQVTNCQLNTVL